LKLISGALAVAEQRFPRVRRPLMILPVGFKESLNEFIGREFVIEFKHQRDSFPADNATSG
jgi:hypothetical protein